MKKLLAALLMGASLLTAAPGVSAQEQQLRIGTLVPKNSLYHRQLMLVGEAWRTAQGGGKYLVFPDGSQG
ncbi:MAG: C4-dicarboxylate ABC transporter substrate-binding protein, partial [Hydrogenophaga sp.]|nr:C4-dicarboxylate ABC transporter substrate-binding protein [Hydrogenophaga sp.]